MNGLLKLLLPLLLSALAAYTITPIVIKLANKYKLVDDPKKNKHPKVIHKLPTPRGGGLAIYLAFAAASLIFLPLDKHLIGILSGGMVLIVMGLLDDRYDLSPYLRFPIQFFAAVLPIASGIGIAFINNPLGGSIDLSLPQITFNFLGEARSIWVLSDIFALFWIVGLMNILNMGAKGVDGQLSGVVIISSLVIAVLSFKYSADITEWPVLILSLIVAGSFLGFLPWHFFPQKIMPGFSGSTLAGFLLAVLSILTTTKVGTLLIVLGIPIVDTGYTIVRRVINGKSPFWGDTGHLHHRLLAAGYSKKQVAYIYWGFSFALGIIALNLNTSSKFYTIIGIVLIVGALLLWLTHKPRGQIYKYD